MEDNHPAIIDKDMWEAVQLEMERKKVFAEKHGFKRTMDPAITHLQEKRYAEIVVALLAERFGTPMMIGLEGKYGDIIKNMRKK